MAVHTRWHNSCIRDRLERLRGRLTDERGVSLVLAMLIVSALSITTAGLASLVISNEHAFGRDKQENLSFNTAEAGLNYGLSTLAASVDPNGTAPINTWYPTSYPSTHTPAALPAGTGGLSGDGWWAQKTASDTWTLWSQATSPDTHVVRQLTTRVKSVTQIGTITPASLAWAYGLFVASPGSCFSPGGNANLDISVYVNGDLCISGGAGIAEPASSTSPSVKVFAKGKITISGSGTIGASSKPIYSVTALQGCTGKNGVICSQNGSKVWASLYNPTGTALTKPSVYPDTTYNSGDWSHPVCSTGSFLFDNDTTRNDSAGTVNIFPASSYNCTVYKTSSHVAGNEIGQLVWNASTKMLTATGVIFIDGDLSVGNNTAVGYTNGTSASIYVDGTATLNGQGTVCGPPQTLNGNTCSGSWDGTQGAIVLVVLNQNNASIALKANGGAEYNLAAYVVGNYSNNGNSFVTGPVVTDTASVSGTGNSEDLTNPPPGTPGASTSSPGSTAWGVIPGTWAQLKPS